MYERNASTGTPSSSAHVFSSPTFLIARVSTTAAALCGITQPHFSPTTRLSCEKTALCSPPVGRLSDRLRNHELADRNRIGRHEGPASCVDVRLRTKFGCKRLVVKGSRPPTK